MKRIMILALPLLHTACTMDEEGTLNPVASIFTSSDLATGTVNPIEEADISGIMASLSDFWAEVNAASLADSVSCMNEKLMALPVQADKANVSLVAEMDAAECFDSEELGLTVTSAPFRFAMWLGCQNKDLEDLNGKSFGDLGDNAALKCESESEQKTLVNTEFKVLATGILVNDDGEEVTLDYGYRSLNATQTEGGEPCTLTSVDEGWLWSSDCVSVSKQEVIQMDLAGQSVTDALTADYLRLDFKDLVESKDVSQPFYVSGSFAVTLNDWKGAVVYQGAATPPNWTMARGDSEVKGTLGLLPLKAVKLSPWARLGYHPRK